MAVHSEYVFSLQDIKDLVNDPNIQGSDLSVSITLNFTQDGDKVFRSEVKADVVNSTGEKVSNISMLGCPRPPGCP